MTLTNISFQLSILKRNLSRIISKEDTFHGIVFVMRDRARKFAKFWQRYSKTDACAGDPQSDDTSRDVRRKRKY